MKIINDLASGAVKNNKKDTLAIKISILLAVILLGTVIFIFDSINTEQYEYVKKAIGDYHLDIAEIDESFYNSRPGSHVRVALCVSDQEIQETANRLVKFA